ncbi:Uncharacterised protein [Delftia tsuruhatensis]|uniref:DUF4148 domain-containing protein n=1 Tax=Delftia tsuruhatensis TaxID=180282 RepID=UPI001E819320|nr:DUF4148 domain-containing protein [Delftia tsuruhatensis]CAB5703273.1 Uncharacterised protein [Delftia tsuruhatensis]CAC9684499.1 Uncharacterised protein [Delftia tsuruhatensis]
MRTSRFITLAALTLGLAGSALAQDGTYPATVTATAATGISRAQVLADLEMWHRAGLTYLSDREIDYRSEEYQRGLERYRQLLASPAYQEAVARLEKGHAVANK